MCVSMCVCVSIDILNVCVCLYLNMCVWQTFVHVLKGKFSSGTEF